MKIITIYLFTIIFFSLTTFGQSNNANILKIEKRVLKINQDSTLKTFKVPESEIIKVKRYYDDENIHVYKKESKVVKIDYQYFHGGFGTYEFMKIYLHNNKPILIEKEAKVVSKKYLIDGNIEVIDIYTLSKTYIRNWDKNEFDYMLWNKKSNQYEHQKGDGLDVMFKGEKFDIIRILKLSQSDLLEILSKN
jgi:hypothetical protein